MSDFFGEFTPSNFGEPNRDNVWIFRGSIANEATVWQTFQIPQSALMLFIVAVAGGGGGGGGASYTSGNTRSGGGGGAGGVVSRLLIPAIFLPQNIYILAGNGGNGGQAGAPGTAGTSGSASYVSVSCSANSQDIILQTGTSVAGGGGGGDNMGAAAAGAADSTIAYPKFAPLGIKFDTSGMGTGQIGGYGAVGGSINPSSYMTTGGAGGGGADASFGYAGGDIAAAGLKINTIPGGTPGAAVGSAGVIYWEPMLFTGGSGGAGSWQGSATVGGQGGPGCGGGGGGGGVTGGTGGPGGAGLVAIVAW